jgi:hypothetical protein
MGFVAGARRQVDAGGALVGERWAINTPIQSADLHVGEKVPSMRDMSGRRTNQEQDDSGCRCERRGWFVRSASADYTRHDRKSCGSASRDGRRFACSVDRASTGRILSMQTIKAHSATQDTVETNHLLAPDHLCWYCIIGRDCDKLRDQ